MKIKFLGQEIGGTVIDGRFYTSRPRREFWPVVKLLYTQELTYSETAKLGRVGITFLPTDLTVEEFEKIKAIVKDESLTTKLHTMCKPL